MPKKKIRFLVVLFTVTLIGCSTKKQSAAVYHLIPQPNSLTEMSGVFELTRELQIVINGENPELRWAADAFNEVIEDVLGYSADIVSGDVSGSITLQLSDQIKGEEAYELDVRESGITITGSTPAGVFYGVQSLRQLLPVNIDESAKAVTIPSVKIKDAPRFSYRGMHLDVARHFYGPDFVKRYIDLIALHKMNTLHWHLTEDQGWRIEIKKYPKLTEVGAWRDETLIGHGGKTPFEYDGKRYGGFYTQEEIRDVVAYAQKKFVTIIPEIEMPGHSQAALAAYPDLACTEGPFEVAKRWGVFEDVYCPKEETFQFLENVLLEVFQLFPSKYVHIGGDECPKKRWEESAYCQNLMKREGLQNEHELQSYFISRMEKFINSEGRSIIGWDEILEGGLAPNATVMSWRGTQGGIAAARQGHDVIMTPGSHCYFDHYQSKDTENEPLAIGGFTDVEKVYHYEPIPDELSEEERKYILGAQANVWTEYIKTPDHVEYMILPRMTALSEVVWSSKKDRNWVDFQNRLQTQRIRYDQLGLNYAKHVFQKIDSVKTQEL